MDLFSIIMSYLNDYIFVPIDSWFRDHGFLGSGLGDYNIYIYENKITFGYLDSIYVDANGNQINLNSINFSDLIIFIITLVIFILLFIVAVKFIVWLFKQISFVTRF